MLVVNTSSSYQYDRTQSTGNIMSALVHFFHNLFSAESREDDDPLMGAVDLSDTAYCAEMLERYTH
jgi:hypothetical protein